MYFVIDKYDCKDFVHVPVKNLFNNLNPENAIEIYECAYQLNNIMLMKTCLEVCTYFSYFLQYFRMT